MRSKISISNIIVISTIFILTAAVVILAVLSGSQNIKRIERQDNAVFVIKADGREYNVTMDIINNIGITDFTADKKNSGLSPVSVKYQGVPLKTICDELDIDISGFKNCVASAADGFYTSVPIGKVEDEDNVWIAVGLDNKSLLKREDGGDGPYMLVVRKDTFSQYWCKYLVELEFK